MEAHDMTAWQIALAFLAVTLVLWLSGIITGPTYYSCIDAGYSAIDCAHYPDAPQWAKDKAAY